MNALSTLMARIAAHPLPDGIEPRLTPIGRAIRRYGNHVPRSALHAVNTLTPDEYAKLAFEAKRSEVRRCAEDARRLREDRAALQEEARKWRW